MRRRGTDGAAQRVRGADSEGGMSDDLSNWDAGEGAAARAAYQQHVRERTTTIEVLAHPSANCPDCGPFLGAWYPGDLDGACKAHAQHAHHDWRLLA